MLLLKACQRMEVVQLQTKWTRPRRWQLTWIPMSRLIRMLFQSSRCNNRLWQRQNAPRWQCHAFSGMTSTILRPLARGDFLNSWNPRANGNVSRLVPWPRLRVVEEEAHGTAALDQGSVPMNVNIMTYKKLEAVITSKWLWWPHANHETYTFSSNCGNRIHIHYRRDSHTRL